MKIKKLLFLCAPLISVASVATIVTTSCNKSDGGGASTSSVIDKITPEYFGGDEGLIDAGTPGLLECFNLDPELPTNEIKYVGYAFTSAQVEIFLSNYLFDIQKCNVESVIQIDTQNTKEDTKKMIELQDIFMDENSTVEQKNNAFGEMIELKYKNTTIFIKGTYSFISYEDILVDNPSVTKKMYDVITKTVKKADKDYDVLAKKLLYMWIFGHATL
ncbi:MAG: hypothetical protein Ta2E_03540 [Mycoplasmoidaceae bacterium]|nr:MAG: hypothetical protein Ta2E_03540 [Mycoplasmoidaceae bacterium]